MPELTYELVSGLLRYDPDSGNIFRIRNGKAVGKYLGNDRYRSLSIEGKSYPQHRIAWLLYYGRLPEHHINHKNGKRGDNRIDNLEDVPVVVNLNSFSKISSRNRSGYKNVSYSKEKNKWIATKTYYGINYFLGLFDTPEEANNAVIEFKNLNDLPLYDNEKYVKSSRTIAGNSPEKAGRLTSLLMSKLGTKNKANLPGNVRLALYKLIDQIIEDAITDESVDSFYERISKKLSSN